jgi:CRP/FNR family transcriptional regulator, cyclic AMP receptor protein
VQRHQGGTRLILDDPELGGRLTSEQRDAATRVVVPELRMQPGEWHPGEIPLLRRSRLGIVLLEGVLVREVVIGAWRSAELVGPGDVLSPWRRDEEPLVPAETAWSVIEPARAAVLHPGRLAATAAWPVILEVVASRLADRAERLAVHRAIAQLPRVELRLLALLWHLAGRFGRVGPAGVTVPLRLSHQALGRLVGARRPTVSLALRELAAGGHVLTRPGEGFQLGTAAPEELRSGVAGMTRRRRRTAPGDEVEAMARQLRARARSVADRRAAETGMLTHRVERMQDLRRRGAEIRRQSAELREELRRLRAG